jgi:hypothetical protein
VPPETEDVKVREAPIGIVAEAGVTATVGAASTVTGIELEDATALTVSVTFT